MRFLFETSMTIVTVLWVISYGQRSWTAFQNIVHGTGTASEFLWELARFASMAFLVRLGIEFIRMDLREIRRVYRSWKNDTSPLR